MEVAIVAVKAAFTKVVGWLATPLVPALGEGGAIAVAQFAVKAAGMAALSAATAALAQPNIPARNPGEWIADPNAGIPFAISDRIGVAGNIIYKNTYGKAGENRNKSLVTVLSGAGPITSVISFTADKQAVSFDGSGAATGKYAGAMWRDIRLGNQPDTALVSPTLDGQTLPSWGSSHKLSGKAAFMLTLRGDSKNKSYPGGREPAPLHVLSGIKGYDPRYDSTWPGGSGSCRLNDRSTWLTISNGAIADLNWCLGLRENGKVVGGLGANIEAIDAEAFIEAANVADLNGWKVCAYPRSTDEKAEVRAGLLQSAGAMISRRAGLISCITRGAVKTPVATITVADTAGPIEVETCANVLNRLNTMTPRYLSEAHDWQMVDAAPVSASEYVTEDRGRVRSEQYPLPYVSSAKQAAELTALHIANSREGIAGTIPLKPYLREIKPGDAFLIDGPGFVADNLKCLCLQREYDPRTDQVRITFVSETDGKIAWALGQVASPPPTPALSSVDRGEIAAPEAGSWSATGGVIGSGATQPAIIVTGASDNAYAQQVIVDFRKDGDTTWNPWTEADSAATRFELTGFEPNTAYEIAISYRSLFGAISERLVLGPVTTGGLTADDTLTVRPYAADTIKSTFSSLTGLTAANAAIATVGSGHSVSFTPTGAGSTTYLQWALARPGGRAHRVRLRIRAVGADITAAMWDGRLTYSTPSLGHSLTAGRFASIPFPAGGLPVGQWRDIEFQADGLTDYLDSTINQLRFYLVKPTSGRIDVGRIEAGYAGGATEGARAGTDLFRTDGVTPMTQAEVRTPEGISAGITGQAPAATDSTIVPGAGRVFTGEETLNRTPGDYLSLISGNGTRFEAKQPASIEVTEVADVLSVVQVEKVGSGSANVIQTLRSRDGVIFQRRGSNATTWAAWHKQFGRQSRPTFDAGDLLDIGSTVASRANFRTDLGISAGIAGQGTLATKSSVAEADLGSSAVSTVKIAANAVTDPVRAFTAGSISLDNTNEVIIQSVVRAHTGGDLQLRAVADVFVGFHTISSQALFMRFYHGSTLIKAFKIQPNVVPGGTNRYFDDTYERTADLLGLAADTYTFSVTLALESNAGGTTQAVANRDLLVRETKR